MLASFMRGEDKFLQVNNNRMRSDSKKCRLLLALLLDAGVALHFRVGPLYRRSNSNVIIFFKSRHVRDKKSVNVVLQANERVDVLL